MFACFIVFMKFCNLCLGNLPELTGHTFRLLPSALLKGMHSFTYHVPVDTLPSESKGLVFLLTFQSVDHNHMPGLPSKHHECPVWLDQQQTFGNLPELGTFLLALKKFRFKKNKHSYIYTQHGQSFV